MIMNRLIFHFFSFILKKKKGLKLRISGGTVDIISLHFALFDLNPNNEWLMILRQSHQGISI